MKSAEAFNIKVPIIGQQQKTTAKPLFDWVFCHRVDAPQVSQGGIQIVGGEKAYEEAEVVAVGPESKSGLRAGMRVQFIGRPPEVTVDGVTLYAMRDAVPIGSEIKYEYRQVGENMVDLPMHLAYIVCVLERETVLQ